MEERIREKAMVKVDAGGELYFSSLRQYHGRTGIAVERLRNGAWVIRSKGEELVLPRRILRRV